MGPAISNYNKGLILLSVIGEHCIIGIITDLDRLDEGEEENPDADTSPEELDESGRPEESEESDVDELRGVDDAA